jgi:hypothetical protein
VVVHLQNKNNTEKIMCWAWAWVGQTIRVAYVGEMRGLDDWYLFGKVRFHTLVALKNISRSGTKRRIMCAIMSSSGKDTFEESCVRKCCTILPTLFHRSCM